jgi:DNA-directed RNA polymerase specialized sigma24 family protein
MYSYSDAELIVLIRQKDPAACNYLFEKYAGPLHGLIKQIIPDPEHADRLLEDVFIFIFQTIDTYDPAKSRLFTWMLQVTREAAIQKLRTLYSRRYNDPSVILKENAGVAQLISKLNREEQELISLSYFKGYSAEDVARQLNMTVAAVKTKIRIALAHLNTL